MLYISARSPLSMCVVVHREKQRIAATDFIVKVVKITCDEKWQLLDNTSAIS